MLRGTLFNFSCNLVLSSLSASIITFRLVCSRVSLNSATKDSFSVAASDLKVSPSKLTSEFGIGIEPNLLRIPPKSSLHRANPYFLIHCLPTSLICSYCILS